MSTPVWKRSAVLRKSVTAVTQVPRLYRRARATPQDYIYDPPLLANSFPKSGTHLLVQIVEAFPRARQYGTFIASIPSVPFRERSRRDMLRRLSSMVPGEVVPAHLHYEPEYETALGQRNAVRFFIYRDPRDVAVSEAHYLTHMNRWHRLHRHFVALPDAESRISFSICGAKPGFPYPYPHIAERFRRYAGWLDDPETFAIRYEDLRSEERRDATVRDMIQHYLARTPVDHDPEELVRSVIANIRPEQSHTFRRGTMGGWREVFTATHRHQMKELAGDLLVKLGYEDDLEW